MLLVASGWRNAAMLAVGALISAASILEWQRLVRLINARLDKQKTPRSAPLVVTFFVLRLTVFAGVIYGSLKCFQGSVVALLCGLGLAVVATAGKRCGCSRTERPEPVFAARTASQGNRKIQVSCRKRLLLRAG